MHILPFKALYPNMELIPAPEYFFATVREEFPEYHKSGFFRKAPAAGFYIYQIECAHRHYWGLVACVDLRDYAEGAIRKHEQTIADHEQKQMQLVLHRNASVKPVLLTYPHRPTIRQWLEQQAGSSLPMLEVHFEQEQQHHRIWAVHQSENLQTIRTLFLEQVPVAYIADGHHRLATAALVHEKLDTTYDKEKYGVLIAAFFSTAELEILDFNRVVYALEDMDVATFVAKLSQVFDIEILEVAQRPGCKHELTMFLHGHWYRLSWRAHVLAQSASGAGMLDAALLNDWVLKRILGIENVRNDPRIDYVEGPRGLEGLRKRALRDDRNAAFALYPIQIEDLLALADMGEVLPPKSTWFEPRMKNGMLVQVF